MHRRTFLMGATGGLVALIGGGATVWTQVPVIPKRPEPDIDASVGWIAYKDGHFTLTLPRAELGQNIATALKQVACTELGVDWDLVDVALHDTTIQRVKATVGSESVMLFSEPLAQSCAALRDAIAEGRSDGAVAVTQRPVSELRALRVGGLIGTTLEIEQGREIVTGAPLYAADVDRPGMLYGQVLRVPSSTDVASRPLRWNATAAKAMPGFVAIVEECGPPIGKAQGIGIVAARPGALEAIAEALEIEWDVSDPHPQSDVADAIDIDAKLANGGLRHSAMDGEPQDGPWDIDLRIDLPFAAHAPIEPRAAAAEWTGETLKLWVGSQDAFYIKDVLMDAFGLAPDAVTVQSSRIGGGFGGKAIATVEAEAAALARATGAPMKIQWTRAQEFALGYHRPPSSQRLKARLESGRITDWDRSLMSSHVFFSGAVVPAWMQAATDRLAGDDGVARGMVAPYVLGRTKASYDVIRLPVHTAAWRGLGAGPNVLAIESAMDEAARVSGMNPLDFRRAHIDDPPLVGVLNRVAEIADWGTPARPVKGFRVGRGIACGIYKKTSYAAAVAHVSVDDRGHVQVDRIWCTHDCGLVVNPDQVRAQCEGNIVWSIGMILSDDLPIEQGFVTAETFADAPIPQLTEVPPITVDLIESTRPPQGAGETLIVAGPGAIANAIRDATGKRPTRFPIREGDLPT